MLTIPRTHNTKNKNTETKKRTPVRKRTQTLKRGGVVDGDALDTCQLPSITLTQQFNVFAMNIIENDICDKSFNKSLLELKSMVDAKGRRDSLAVRTGQQVIDCYKASDFYDENDTIYVFEVLKSGDSSITDANRNDFSMMNMFCKIDEVSKRLVDIIMSKQRFEERRAAFRGGGNTEDEDDAKQGMLAFLGTSVIALCCAFPPAGVVLAVAIGLYVIGLIAKSYYFPAAKKDQDPSTLSRGGGNENTSRISELIGQVIFSKNEKLKDKFVQYMDESKPLKASALAWKGIISGTVCWNVNESKLREKIIEADKKITEADKKLVGGKPKRTRKVETLKTEKSTKLIDKDTSKKLNDKPKRTNKKSTTAVTKK